MPKFCHKCSQAQVRMIKYGEDQREDRGLNSHQKLIP